MPISKSEFAEALKSKPVRPLDPANLSNDNATLQALAGALNVESRAAKAIEKLDSFQVDTTKYSGPTGAANATMPLETLPDESSLPQQPQRPVSAVAQPPAAQNNPAPTTAPQAAPSLPSVGLSNQLKLILTGRHTSEVIEKIGAKEFAIDSGILVLAQAFFPSVDLRPAGPAKVVPGAQALLDAIKAWGKGEISAAFPVNPTRAMFVAFVHSLHAAKQLPGGIDWSAFGKNEGFWTDSVVEAAKAFHAENPDQRIVFTGINSVIELKYFQALGCTHWHVSGPSNVKVTDFSTALDNNVIKQISVKRNGAKLRCLWVGNTPSPSPRLWTLDEFIAAARIQPPVEQAAPVDLGGVSLE